MSQVPKADKVAALHELSNESGQLRHAQFQAFYQVGGTLNWDAPSYLMRDADQALFEELRRGELCYVLDTRQVGKSSLLVRTAVRLLDQGIDIVQIDIGKQGRNVTPESWYLGLLYQFTDQLSLWEAAEAFWESHASFSPVQRWFLTIQEVVLANRDRRLVAFLDEIDSVRGLPFSADEFLAGIRAVAHDQQSYSLAEAAPWKLLTFCFAGAATPAQLTSDVRATPFNIGTRIELADFTEQDALPLAQGFATVDSEQRTTLIARVVHWTGGHPYLTQRLCYEVAKAGATTPQQVDQLCRETFLDRKARETDPNLHFVHERILRDQENDPGDMLRLYATVRKGASVRYDPTSGLANTLRLAGLLTVSEGRLQVRNRIYAEQFDPTWIQESLRNLPDLARRKAYWQGFRRAAFLGGVLLLSTTAAIWFGLRAQQEHREKTQLSKKIDQQKERLSVGEGRLNAIIKKLTEKDVEMTQKTQELRARKQAVEDLKRKQGATALALRSAQSDLGAAQQQVDAAQQQVDQVRGQVTQLQASARAAVLRVEQLGQDEFKIAARAVGQEKTALSLGIRTVGSLLDAGLKPSGETMDSLASLVNRGLVRTAHLEHKWKVTCVGLSPDGKMAVTAGRSNEIWVWDMVTGRHSQTIQVKGSQDIRPGEQFCTIQFSPSGDQVLSAAQDGVIRLWKVTANRLASNPRVITVEQLGFQELGAMLFARFSPNGREIAVTVRIASNPNRYGVLVIDSKTHKPLRQFGNHRDSIWSLCWSSDGKLIATTGNTDAVKIWNAQTGDSLPPPDFKVLDPGKTEPVQIYSLQFQGSDILLCGDSEGRISVWYRQDGQFHHTFDYKTSKRKIWSIDSNVHGLVVAGDSARHVRIWRLGSPDSAVADLETHHGPVLEVRFVPSEHDVREFVFASASDDQSVDIWHLSQNTYGTDQGAAMQAAFSEDSLQLIMADTGGLARRRPVAPSDLRSLIELAIKENPGDAVTAIALSPNTKLLASGTNEGRLRLWNAYNHSTLIGKDSRKVLRQVLTEAGGTIHAVAFSPDGQYLASVGRGVPSGEIGGRECLRLWSVTSGKCLKVWPSLAVVSGERLAPPTDAKWGYQLYSVAFNKDGKTVLCACEDGGLYIADPGKDAFVKRLRPADLSVGVKALDACFSSDGRYAAAAYSDGNVLVWDLRMGQVVRTLEAHKGRATSVATSPDGKWIASAGSDGVVLIWSMDIELAQQTQPSFGQTQPYLRLEAHSGPINSIRFDPESQRVITASQDGTVRVFPVTPEEYLHEAKAMMQYRPDRPYPGRPWKRDADSRKRDESVGNSKERK